MGLESAAHEMETRRRRRTGIGMTPAAKVKWGGSGVTRGWVGDEMGRDERRHWDEAGCGAEKETEMVSGVNLGVETEMAIKTETAGADGQRRDGNGAGDGDGGGEGGWVGMA